jgi:hypothetical protein
VSWEEAWLPGLPRSPVLAPELLRHAGVGWGVCVWGGGGGLADDGLYMCLCVLPCSL